MGEAARETVVRPAAFHQESAHVLPVTSDVQWSLDVVALGRRLKAMRVLTGAGDTPAMFARAIRQDYGLEVTAEDVRRIEQGRGIPSAPLLLAIAGYGLTYGGHGLEFVLEAFDRRRSWGFEAPSRR